MLKRRIYALLAAICLLFATVVWRLYTVANGGLPYTVGRAQGTVSVSFGTARGTIYDRHLKPLVNATSRYTLAVGPSADTLKKLSAVLDAETWSATKSRMEQGRPAVVTLGELLPAAMKGAAVVSVPVRYGENYLARHLIGYVSGDRGVTGIESAYDALLSDAAGKATATYAVDGSGSVLSGVSPTVENTLDAAKAGVVLTVDAAVQEAVEAVGNAAEGLKGAAVVMDPATGEILAMASFPGYHAEQVTEALSREDSPLINRALSNYNLGSVFKIVTTAAALEQGIPESTVFTCNGSIAVGGTTFHCHNRLGHGELTMGEALAASCNCYFIQLAEAIGAEALYTMASDLGFEGSIPLCTGLRTASATQPSLSDLQSPAALANFSFGQGNLLGSPIHVAQMTAAVVNGGRFVRPTVVKGTVDAAGNAAFSLPDTSTTVFSETTASRLAVLLRQAVNSGTGGAALPRSGGAGGKTGTAETGWVIDGHEVSQSWFAGFYPAYGPRYVVVILSEDAGETGVKAADLFREICNGIATAER